MEMFSGKREIKISTWVWLRWTWKPKSSKGSMIKPRWFSSFVAEEHAALSHQHSSSTHSSVICDSSPVSAISSAPGSCRCCRFFHRLSARHERERKEKPKLWFKSLWWFFTYVSSRRLLRETEYFLYPCMPPLCSGSLSLPVWPERATDGGAAEAAEEAKEAKWKCGFKCEV